jgi:hypothetical protein
MPELATHPHVNSSDGLQKHANTHTPYQTTFTPAWATVGLYRGLGTCGSVLAKETVRLGG